jgi:tRNA A-37 threonylcarbamoyl transferase component Bud32
MIAWVRTPMTAKTLAALLRDAPTVERELKRDKQGVVTLHVIDGRRWVVKRETRSGMAMRLRHLLRCSAAWRQWRGAERLRNIGVRINEPVALVHEGGGTQTLVLPFVDGVNLHEWLAKPPPEVAAEARLRVARAIGSQMGRVTGAGWINRDHKPTNLMIDPACEQRGEQPVLIDLAGIRRRPRRGQFIGPAKALEMFHVMMRAAKRAGPVSLREQLTLLHAAMAEDPTLGRNAAGAARTIATLARARPLSYDPGGV